MLTTLPGAYPSSPTHHPPRRSDSLSSNYAKPKPTTPLVQAREDAKFARVVLNSPGNALSEGDELGEEEGIPRNNERQRELVEMLTRMTGWVEELTVALQHAYKDQSDLETALTLTRSNLQLALANNEMLEDALKRAGGSGKDVGWRRWSEREDMRRSSSVKDLSSNLHDGHSPSPSPSPSPLSGPPSSHGSRFFNFSSLIPSNSSPTEAQPSSVQSFASAASSAAASRSSSPAPLTTQRERELKAQLDKERKTLRELAASKAELENELESLSQALFEEANKMVASSNRKLAETEEELRITMEQRDALKGALRIVEGENGALRSNSQSRSYQTPNPVQVFEISKRDSAAEELEIPTPRADSFDHANISPSSSAGDSSSIFSSTSTSTSVPLAPALSIPVVTITTPTHVTSLRPLSRYPQGSHWSPVTPITPGSDGSSSPNLSPNPESPVFSDGQSPSPPPSEQFMASQSSSSLELDPVLHRTSLTIAESDASEHHTALPSLPTTSSPSSTPPSHFSPLSPSTSLSPASANANQLPERFRSHRWSVLPQSPRSRAVVREEFEEVLRRMKSMVEEETGEGSGSSSGEPNLSEGKVDKSYFEDDEDDGEDGDEDEGENERLARVKIEEEVEDMVSLRQDTSTRHEMNSDFNSHNPWES